MYAVEVDDDKVDALKELVSREGLDNVEVVRGDFADPMLPNGEIDLAMTCLTYHHIDEREVYFSQLLQDLSPTGRVAHLDDTGELPIPLIWLASKGRYNRPSRPREFRRTSRLIVLGARPRARAIAAWLNPCLRRVERVCRSSEVSW